LCMSQWHGYNLFLMMTRISCNLIKCYKRPLILRIDSGESSLEKEWRFWSPTLNTPLLQVENHWPTEYTAKACWFSKTCGGSLMKGFQIATHMTSYYGYISHFLNDCFKWNKLFLLNFAKFIKIIMQKISHQHQLRYND